MADTQAKLLLCRSGFSSRTVWQIHLKQFKKCLVGKQDKLKSISIHCNILNFEVWLFQQCFLVHSLKENGYTTSTMFGDAPLMGIIPFITFKEDSFQCGLNAALHITFVIKVK